MLRFLIGFLFLVTVSANCNANSLAILNHCYSNFLSFYGFNFQGTLPAYWEMHEARGRVIRNQGITIQPKICNVATSLYDCTSGTHFDYTCLMSMGVNASDAQDYFTDRAVGEYQCTTGYSTLMSQWACMGDVRDSGRPELQACTDALNAAIAKGGNVCPAVNVYLTCQSPYYEAACGYNAGVFICGSNRAGVLSNNEVCQWLGVLDECPPYK
ncbi:unnamed protein product, partial [Mesorhabditis belari]|uniref:Uncharacterized protein n=1 Tax=Mesorhabditis belari TaxID=2138241 RepID=A0AAF3FKC7_9BILA